MFDMEKLGPESVGPQPFLVAIILRRRRKQKTRLFAFHQY